MNNGSLLRTDLLFDPFNARWGELRAVALAADKAGFDGLWTWDHFMGSVHRAEHVLECWTVLSALAAITETVAIGPLTLNVANRHPGLVAVMAATLQQVSGGRLLLGVGAGGGASSPYAAEQAAFDRPVRADPVRRWHVEEAVEVLRQVWSGQVQPTVADYYPLGEGAGFLQPKPLPPIVVGAFGPKMAELAGRIGDGINTQAQHPHLAELLEIARAAHAASGRTTPFLATVFAPFSDRWLDDNRPERARLRQLGVERLVLVTGSAIDAQRIEAAGRTLRSAV